MPKKLYIAEKPSVAKEFAKALKLSTKNKDGYMESESAVITWCVGHLITMSYPEAYDSNLKKWSFETLPFLPKEFKYEVIPNVSKQFNTIKYLLNRDDIDTIYICTDSGREGEYIYRLVDQMANVPNSKEKRRVWIDSQTEEEIIRGIEQAKLMSEYNHLSDAAYLRAKEDYLMGINFSRILTLKYGQIVTNYLQTKKWSVISVGRVMTCVMGMAVRREREIRSFVKTPFYRVIGLFEAKGQSFEGEWRAVEGSKYFASPDLYKDNGFKNRKTAEQFLAFLGGEQPIVATIAKIEKRKELKYPPLLFNLAELQNECSRLFKISPDETLRIIQQLYERKLVTYPRTDARVLSTAVSKEISKNLLGIKKYIQGTVFAEEILQNGSYKTIGKSRYVNDKQITDHYAIIPTGQGLNGLDSLSEISQKLYEVIVRRFLSIFYPPAVYQKVSITSVIQKESFFSTFKVLEEQGYLKVIPLSFIKQKDNETIKKQTEEVTTSAVFVEIIKQWKKGMILSVSSLQIKEGETTPPKRYNSGSIILAMENAGQFIEDEELRAQIKGSGIGTSATRAEILNKLIKIDYLKLNKKTQVITPSLQGEVIYEVVNASIRSLLNPDLTASWEKGLNYVAEGTVTKEEYMEKLENFVGRLTKSVKDLDNQMKLRQYFDEIAIHYKKCENIRKL